MLKDIGAMIRTSLEEIEAETNIVVEAGELEAAVVDIIDAGTASERADGQIEDLLEVAQGLENLLDIATESLQAGGLTAIDAKLFKIAVESYSSRVTELTLSSTPALEAFGGTAGRYESTTVAIESLTDSLKAVWGSIGTAFKKSVSAIKDFISVMSNSMKALETRAKALHIAAGKTKGTAEGKIGVASGTLSYEGKADIKSVIKGLNATATILEAVITHGLRLTNKTYANIEAIVKEETAATIENDNTDKALLKAGAISGGYVIGERFEVTKVVKSTVDDIDVPALADIEALASAALDISNVINRQWGAFETMLKRTEELEKVINKYIAKQLAEQGKESKTKHDGNALKIIMKVFHRNLVSAITHISSISCKSAIAAVTLGEKSLRKYRA